MKRLIFTLITTLGFACGMSAMDYETAREQAYYLTDKMAYELNLNEEQYNDAYEINLDYLLSLTDESDIDAMYLDYRNADLQYILYEWQWELFMNTLYFWHPVYWVNGGWYFPIFRHYAHGYYFFDRPGIFYSYRGAHGRAHYLDRSYYSNRRSTWNGGLRGKSNTMVGHPNGNNGGRFGTAGTGRGSTNNNGVRSRNDNNGPNNGAGNNNGGVRGGNNNNGNNNGGVRGGSNNNGSNNGGVRGNNNNNGNNADRANNNSNGGARGGSGTSATNRNSSTGTSGNNQSVLRSSSRNTVGSGSNTNNRSTSGSSASRSNTTSSSRNSGTSTSSRSSSSTNRSSSATSSRSTSSSSARSSSSSSRSSSSGASRGGSSGGSRSGGGRR